MNKIPDDACGEHPSNYKEDYRAMFATLTDELRNVLTDEDSRLSHGARRAVLYVKEMLATFPVDFVFDSGEVKADPSAEPVPLPDTVYAALSDQAKRRTSRENVVDVLHALIAAELRAAPVAAQAPAAAGDALDADERTRYLIEKKSVLPGWDEAGPSHSCLEHALQALPYYRKETSKDLRIVRERRMVVHVDTGRRVPGGEQRTSGGDHE